MIDKPILDIAVDQQGRGAGDPDGGERLIIMPIRKGKDQDRERSFRDALKWAIDHHRETLQKLAK